MKGLGQSPSSKLVIPTDATKLLGAIPAMIEAMGAKQPPAGKETTEEKPAN